MRELFHQELARLTRRAHLAIDVARTDSTREKRFVTVLDLLKAFHTLPTVEDALLAKRNMPPIEGVRGGMAARLLLAIGVTPELLAGRPASEAPAVIWEDVISRAAQQAQARGRKYIATEHLLLGVCDLYRESMIRMGIHCEAIRDAAARLLDPPKGAAS